MGFSSGMVDPHPSPFSKGRFFTVLSNIARWQIVPRFCRDMMHTFGGYAHVLPNRHVGHDASCPYTCPFYIRCHLLNCIIVPLQDLNPVKVEPTPT